MGFRYLPIAMLLLAACPEPNPAPDVEELVVRGTIQGPLPDVPTQVVVLWSTETEEMGDAIYKLGEGTVEGASFSARIPGPLPLEATGYGNVGVGLVALVPADLDLPDGIQVEDFEDDALGITGTEAVIWRSDATTLYGPPWAEAFPVGYACGDCVPAMSPMFDGFTPGACDGLTLYVPLDETTPFCGWS